VGAGVKIKREKVMSGRVDFADVTIGKRLPPIYLGEILRDDFLKAMRITAYALAKEIKVPHSRVKEIVLGHRAISPDTAVRLARYFGTTPDFWINLQSRYDLEAAERTLRNRIEREVSPRS
jgi:antitoxin HigA-1